HSIPRWNHDRHRALRLCLASETDERLRFGGVDVTKLLDLLSFARRNVREFLGAAENSNPTRTARGRATLNGNRSFDPARINLTPVARTIVGRSPREIL